MAGAMSGVELGTVVRQRWPGIKVLLTSGFPDAKPGANGSSPVDDGVQPMSFRLLNKPYRKEDLARAIRAALDE
jgi:hypothetical protein